MKLPNHKIENALGNGSRYMIGDALLDVENKRMIATDGHLIVRSTVQVDAEDQSGLITPAVIRYARSRAAKTEAKNFSMRASELRVIVRTEDETYDCTRPRGTFPSSDILFNGNKATGTPAMVISASVLRKVLDAIENPNSATDAVAFWPGVKTDGKAGSFHDPDAAILVAVCDGEAVGLVMPMRTENTPTAEDVKKRGAVIIKAIKNG